MISEPFIYSYPVLLKKVLDIAMANLLCKLAIVFADEILLTWLRRDFSWTAFSQICHSYVAIIKIASAKLCADNDLFIKAVFTDESSMVHYRNLILMR